MTEIHRIIDSEAAWNAYQLYKHKDWIYQFTDQDLDEINQAIKLLGNEDYNEITRNEFPLEKLGELIEKKFSPQLENGIGVLLMKGINPSHYNDKQLKQLFWGLGLYFGTAVSQSVSGEKLHEVKDEGYQYGDKRARGTNTRVKLWFHNDPCDVAGLFCIRKAKSGGESQLVSSISIHNKLLQDYPELLTELYRPYYFRRHNINTTQAKEYFCHPIFTFENGYFVCNILRATIDRAQELPEVPKMTAQQIKALDVFEALAEDKNLCHHYFLEPGDILWVNNYVALHSRTAFEDYSDPNKKRLMLRLWLSVANSRPLPESYRATYRHIESGAIRGGIMPQS